MRHATVRLPVRAAAVRAWRRRLTLLRAASGPPDSHPGLGDSQPLVARDCDHGAVDAPVRAAADGARRGLDGVSRGARGDRVRARAGSTHGVFMLSRFRFVFGFDLRCRRGRGGGGPEAKRAAELVPWRTRRGWADLAGRKPWGRGEGGNKGGEAEVAEGEPCERAALGGIRGVPFGAQRRVRRGTQLHGRVFCRVGEP